MIRPSVVFASSPDQHGDDAPRRQLVRDPRERFRAREGILSTIFDFEMPDMRFGPVRMGILLHEREKGGIGGAIVHHPDHYVPSVDGTKVYLNAGKDLSVVLDRVARAGGEVRIPKRLIAPGMGYMALISDSEGNTIALHSPE